MNAPMKKQTGPVLYVIDSEPMHKAATCVGCKFALIHDSHFVFCDIQDRIGDFRMPQMIRTYENRGRQVQAGIPNERCAYIHRVETWKAGRRTARDFQQTLRDLSDERGWVEECPGESKWYFKKKNWLVTACFSSRTFTFTNIRRKSGV